MRWGRRLTTAVAVGAMLAAAGPASAAFAEGSRDLYPTNATCSTNSAGGTCRANIEWRTNDYGPAADTHIARRTLFYVYAEAGEVLEMGSSAVGVGSGDITVYDPGVITDSTAEPLPTVTSGTNGFKCSVQRTASGVAAQGKITSRAMELAGPQAVSGGGNPTGYVPCSYVAPSTGIYNVVFYGPTGDGGNADGGVSADVNLTAAGDFSAAQGTSIAAWDLTVRSSAASTTDIGGRLFTYALAAFTGNNGLPVNQTIYVVTTDGFRYQTDTRGLDPNGYLFYGSRTGFLDADGVTPLDHDVLGTSGGGQMSTLDGGVHLSVPSFPLSFEPLSNQTIAAIGIPTAPTTPTFTLLNFDGTIGANNSTVGAGGSFQFTVNEAGTYELIISRDGTNFDPGLPTNVVLRAYVGPGTHTVVWDGRDNVGTPFPVGLNYPVHGQLRVGEYHVPQLDAENSTLGGPTMKLLNSPTGACPFGNAACTTAFYDDRGYQTSSGTDVGTPGAVLCGIGPPTIDHADPQTGYVSTGGQRAYGQNTGGNTNLPCTGSFGDMKGVDTWTYFPSVDDNTVVNILPTPPNAVNDSGTTAVNTALAVAAPGVLANDTGENITEQSHTNPTHGSVTVNADGSYTYTPTTDYSGPDSFTYTIVDDASQTSTATVDLTVTPLAVDDSAVTQPNTPVSIDVVTNDHGSALTVPSVTQPPAGEGSVAIVGGKPVYTPPAGFSGTTTFTYTAKDSSGQTSIATVTVTVLPAALDDTGITAVDTPLVVPTLTGLLSNDSGTSISVQSNTNPSHGSVIVNLDGSYTYTPDPGFSGVDTFTYTIIDGSGHTSTATDTITATPQAVDDSASTPAGTPVSVDVVPNDHGTGLDVTGVTQPPPGKGSVTVVAGQPVYTPPAGFSGIATFTYTVTDDDGQTSTATVTVTVLPVAVDDAVTAPYNTSVAVNVLVNDDGSSLAVISVTQPPLGEGSVTVVAGQPLYTPPAGYVGTTTFTYTVTDPTGNTSTATVTVTVAPQGAPVAVDDVGTTSVDTPLVVGVNGVLGNDAGSNITVQSNTAPTHGTVTVDADGSYTYLPDPGFSGFDSYTYTIVDDASQVSTATVYLTVTPTAVDDSATTPPHTPVSIDVAFNDHGSALAVTAVTQPPAGEGSVAIVAGEPVYTPPAGYSGTTTFTYTVTDSSGQTATATVTVTVPPVHGAAHAKNDLRHGKTGRPVSLKPLGNDTPSHAATWQTSTLRLVDAQTGLAIKTLVAAGEGTWTVGAKGVVTFTPESGFTGNPTPVDYSVSDSNGHWVKAKITIDYPVVHHGGRNPGDPGTPGNPNDPGTPGRTPGDPGSGELPHTGVAALLGTIWFGSGGVLLGTFFLAWGAGGGRRRRRHLHLLG
jgi:CshA-type fibril repeat protein